MDQSSHGPSHSLYVFVFKFIASVMVSQAAQPSLPPQCGPAEGRPLQPAQAAARRAPSAGPCGAQLSVGSLYCGLQRPRLVVTRTTAGTPALAFVLFCGAAAGRDQPAHLCDPAGVGHGVLHGCATPMAQHQDDSAETSVPLPPIQAANVCSALRHADDRRCVDDHSGRGCAHLLQALTADVLGGALLCYRSSSALATHSGECVLCNGDIKLCRASSSRPLCSR